MKTLFSSAIAFASLLLVPKAFGYQKVLDFRVDAACFKVEFDQPTSAVFSCKFPAEIAYKKRDCSSGKLLEHATNQAELTCPDDQHWQMRFRTSDGVVSLLMKVSREQRGKWGVVSNYSIQSAEFRSKTTAKDSQEIL